MRTEKNCCTKLLTTVNNFSSNIQSDKKLIFEDAVQLFESKGQSISHFCCQSCQMTGITMKPSKRNKLLCSMCQASHANNKKNEKDLPIWYDKQGIVQYHVPEQLKCLHEGEKLLIQLVAAYVTLLH